MTATQTISYRKTKTGEWVVYGPASQVVAHQQVRVERRDGTVKIELIERTGRPFAADGGEMVYGYLGATTTSRSRGRKACVTGGNCSSFGTGRSCGGHDCDGY